MSIDQDGAMSLTFGERIALQKKERLRFDEVKTISLPSPWFAQFIRGKNDSAA